MATCTRRLLFKHVFIYCCLFAAESFPFYPGTEIIRHTPKNRKDKKRKEKKDKSKRGEELGVQEEEKSKCNLFKGECALRGLPVGPRPLSGNGQYLT